MENHQNYKFQTLSQIATQATLVSPHKWKKYNKKLFWDQIDPL